MNMMGDAGAAGDAGAIDNDAAVIGDTGVFTDGSNIATDSLVVGNDVPRADGSFEIDPSLKVRLTPELLQDVKDLVGEGAYRLIPRSLN